MLGRSRKTQGAGTSRAATGHVRKRTILQRSSSTATRSRKTPASAKRASSSGAAYEASGDLKNALREHVRAADLMRDNVEAQLRAGKLLVAAGRFPEARARALAALAKDPKNINGLIVLGNALAGLKILTGQLLRLRKPLKPSLSSPSVTRISACSNSAEATARPLEAAFKRAIRPIRNPSPPISIWAISIGRRASGPKRNRNSRPRWRSTRLHLTSIERSQGFTSWPGKRPRASPYLKSVTPPGGRASPSCGLADFYLNDGRMKEAIEHLAPLSKEDEGFKPANLRLAVSNSEPARRAEGYQLLDEILKRFPNDAQTLL